MKATNQPSGITQRTDLPRASRIVVKVGSSSLTTLSGGISEEALSSLVDRLAAVHTSGIELILVSSGAIAAGLAPLDLGRRPRDLATQQAAASVGQGLLMARYTQAFSAHGVTVGQVLLSADDLIRRRQYANAFRALNRLLALGVVPIVNENDTVA
ncbi:MAG: glutamate 5-kinase, partial [Paeniglutamicibacter terrestris]